MKKLTKILVILAIIVGLQSFTLINPKPANADGTGYRIGAIGCYILSIGLSSLTVYALTDKQTSGGYTLPIIFMVGALGTFGAGHLLSGLANEADRTDKQKNALLNMDFDTNAVSLSVPVFGLSLDNQTNQINGANVNLVGWGF